MIQQYIVDASVGVKWLNQTRENHADKAMALLNVAKAKQCELISSNLLLYEICNVLIRGKRLCQIELWSAIHDFFSLPLRLAVTDEDLALETARLAEEYSMTFYDAIYVALAIEHQAILITENTKDQARVGGHIVRHIKDFPFS